MKRRKENILTVVIFFTSVHLALSSEPQELRFDDLPQILVQVNHTSLQTDRETVLFVNDVGQNDYQLFVRLHNMSILTCANNTDFDPPALKFELDGQHSGVHGICQNVSYVDYWETGTYQFLASHNVSIIATGNWSENDYANIYVSVFYGTEHCSQDCEPEGGYCCTTRKCGRGRKIVIDQEPYLDGGKGGKSFIYMDAEDISRAAIQKVYKCIPKSLTCNNIPNCGDYCSSDELEEACSDKCVPGIDGMCWDMSIVWTALLAVVFFVITPTAIIFLICYNGQIALLRRSRMAQDSRVTVNSPPNDLPPTYDEVEEPPPCFCSIIDPTIGMESENEDSTNRNNNDGNVNLGFELTETNVNTAPRTTAPTCNCVKQQTL